MAESKQQLWEKELRKKAEEGKKLKGQQTLTSAVSTSRRLEEFGIKEAANVMSPSVRQYLQGARAVRDVIHYFMDRRPPIRGVLYRARDGTYFVEAQDGGMYASMGWVDISQTGMPAAGATA